MFPAADRGLNRFGINEDEEKLLLPKSVKKLKTAKQY
jgi:hypothetical protein